MVGEAGRHATDQLVLQVPVRAAYIAGRGDGRAGCHDNAIVTQHGAREQGERP